MKGIISIAWRNYIRNLKRYRVLLSALVLIAAVLVMVLAIVLGMRSGIYEKASRYFAGNIVALGYSGTGDSVIEDPETVMQAVEALEDHGIPVQTISRRSTYYKRKSIDLFFSGYYIKQRRLVGVEWELERPVLSSFDFAEGGLPDAEDETAVLISTATAAELRANVGDNIIISIESDRGRTNTVELIVRGIFSESSFFGYSAYLHRHTLNRLKEAPENQIDEIGVYLKNPIRNEGPAAELLAEKMAESLPSFGVVRTRENFEPQAHKERDTTMYGVVTAGAQLEEIEDLLGALTIIASLVMLMFLSIVVVGVSNTFTMLVWDRTREIGTLRALGMQQPRTILLFLSEAGFLGFSGMLMGTLLGAGVLTLIQRGITFPPNLVSTLFFTQGRIRWILPWWGILLIAGLVIGASLLGSLRASLRAGRLPPVDALSRHE
ncbi:MAG: FtsX-like permease family protein [Spirochaetales bacterium]|nr:FtsX-like permease family protein [Spirochaetales bacterium]